MTSNEKLISLIPGMDAIEFTGLAKVLGVPLVKENPNPTSDEDKYIARDFVDVLDGVLNKFQNLNRSTKRELLRVIKKSNSAPKTEVSLNAGNTENTNPNGNENL